MTPPIKIDSAQRTSLIVIATGRYIAFLEPLVASARRHVNGYDRTFVLSDVRPSASSDITWLPWGHIGWPFPTLLRYRAISAYRAELSDSDILIYVDVDMLFTNAFDVTETTGLIAVEHPGYAGAAVSDFPLESNPDSSAFITRTDSLRYVAGGVQGGLTEMYLDACQQMARDVQHDLDRHIVPVWHDESVWNAYCARQPPETILPTQYCTPESEQLADTVIIALDKDHDLFREVARRDRLRRDARLFVRRSWNKTISILRMIKKRVRN